ncbi:MAG: hypothetical protein V4736_04085 [Bdellovibrionota bacterium]
MSKSTKNPDSLSEAIEKLESIGQSATQDIKERFGSDYDKVKDVLTLLAPYLDEIKDSAGHKATEAKNKVEDQIRDNPWVIIGVAGLVGVLVGWFLGGGRKK